MANWETPCPNRDDGKHCDHWYDDEPCCDCERVILRDMEGDNGGSCGECLSEIASYYVEGGQG